MIIEPAKRLNNVQEYYFSRKLSEIARLREQGKSIINLGIGSPDLMPAPSTIEVLQRASTSPANHGYQSYRGAPQLRHAIAKWTEATYETKVDAEKEILPLMGSKEGIMHIMMAFLNPGDEVLVPNPGYPTYAAVAELVGAKVQYYELKEENNWSIDIAALRQSDLSKVKMMWVNYPHMPTGTNGNDELFQELIAFAKEQQILLVNDNPYSLVLNPQPKSILSYEGAMEVAIELNSLSKSHNMAGWRVGWLLGAASYINTVLKVKSNMDSGMFLPLQLAAAEALQNGEEWHQARNRVYTERRELVYALLDKLGCIYRKDQVGLFVWAKVDDEVESVEAFVDHLLYEAGVFITPGFIFGSQGDQYVRVSLCSNVETLKEAIKRLQELSLLIEH